MSSKNLLLVDTNIISGALTPTQTASYVELFRELESSYRFVVTGFTQYELLRTSDKVHRKKIIDYIEKDIINVELSDVLMRFAARVSYLYKCHKSTKSLKISDGDIINAAFSIAKNCPLITIDNNDHPTPFFIELHRHRIVYQSKRSKETIDTAYILSPDLVNIKKCFEDHDV